MSEFTVVSDYSTVGGDFWLKPNPKISYFNSQVIDENRCNIEHFIKNGNYLWQALHWTSTLSKKLPHELVFILASIKTRKKWCVAYYFNLYSVNAPVFKDMLKIIEEAKNEIYLVLLLLGNMIFLNSESMCN